MGRRLYTQIYLAFLLVALAAAVMAGVTAWVVRGDAWNEVPAPVRAASGLLAMELDRNGPQALHAHAKKLGLHLSCGRRMATSSTRPAPCWAWTSTCTRGCRSGEDAP